MLCHSLAHTEHGGETIKTVIMIHIPPSYSALMHCIVIDTYNGHLLTPSIFIEYVNFIEEKLFPTREKKTRKNAPAIFKLKHLCIGWVLFERTQSVLEV